MPKSQTAKHGHSVGRAFVLSHAKRQRHAWSWARAPQISLCARSVWMKQLSCHTDCQEVSRGCTTGESEESIVHRWQSMQASESTLVLKPRTDVTRSPKHWVSFAPWKDRCHQNFFLEKLFSFASYFWEKVAGHPFLIYRKLSWKTQNRVKIEQQTGQ